jgi:putative hydrolase of HD superfamily
MSLVRTRGAVARTREMSQPVAPAAPSSTSSSALDFLLVAGRLKTSKRTGWVHHGVPLPESISDHMYRMALAALLLLPDDGDAPPDYRTRAALIALVHDVGEAITGDIVPHDPMGRAEKLRREEEAMRDLHDLVTRATTPASSSPSSPSSALLLSLYNEYESQSTAEGRAVKDLDKFEMVLQAYEYEVANPGLDLSPFFESVRGKLRGDRVREWMGELERRREELWAGRRAAQREAEARTEAALAGRGERRARLLLGLGGAAAAAVVALLFVAPRWGR